MKLFKKKEDALIPQNKPVVVSVPDIKEYLVQEYEKVNLLRQEKESLEDELELAKETEEKYKAALVTLDEYSKRLARADELLEKEKNKTKAANERANTIKDELNSYKIKFNTIAITKEEITDEVIDKFKKVLVSNITNIKGSLSKKVVCQIIDDTKLLGGVE